MPFTETVDSRPLWINVKDNRCCAEATKQRILREEDSLRTA
ncbi:hypothetical protein [Streptomyces cavernae]|nr:hypothetical protein [Streptomyces cavernae]